MARIHILGAGTPTPTADRFGSSYVVQIGDEHLMFDCGPSATHKLVKAGLFPTQIGYLFFTHHHFDHDVDYPCFLLTRWDQSIGGEKQLEVSGPTLTEQLTHRLMDESEGAFAHDWLARVNQSGSQRAYELRGGKLPRKPPSTSVRDVGPGQVHRGPTWEVSAVVAEHAQPWLDSLAYRIDSEEGSIVITGDTRPCESVREMARGADAMLCCCWDDQERMVQRGEASAGEVGGMCGTTDAAQMAQDASVKRLVLVHTGPYISDHVNMEKGIGDMAGIYDGEIVFSEELMALDLSVLGR